MNIDEMLSQLDGSRAYSEPATLFNLSHKIKITDRVDQRVMKAVQSTCWNGKGVRHEDERLTNSPRCL